MTNDNRPLPLFATAALQTSASDYAARYGFQLVEALSPDLPYLLQLDEEGLALIAQGPEAPGPLRVDFVEGAHAHRRRYGGGAGQPVARAVGIKASAPPCVVDATAGLGGDAFVMATLGCTVTLLERAAVVCALLEDGLRRAAMDPELEPIVRRMQLLHVDAHDWMSSQPAGSVDVVYLDPMFPEEGRTARAKKGMYLFQQLLEGDLDADALLVPARRLAGQRVVVKRPKRAPVLAGVKPSGQQVGQSTRFDLYAPLKQGA